MTHIVIGETIAPHRMARHRTPQAFHDALGRVAKQETDIPLLLTHHRIEAFGIEVTIIDLVAARTLRRAIS